jgi:hypothetical protein
MVSRRGNHEGSGPRQRADGRWQANVRHVDRAGVAHRTSVYGKTATEIRRKVRNIPKRLGAFIDRALGASSTHDISERAVRKYQMTC